MAYNNFYPAGYQPIQFYPQQQQQQTQTGNGIIWVSGESGAKAYLVAPNSSVVLFDSEAQCIYLKSADASGMPSIKTLDYTVRDSAQQAAKFQGESDFATKEDVSIIRKEIDALKAKFEVGKETKK